MQPPGVEPEPPRFEPKPAFGDARMPPPPPAVGKQKPAAPPVASTSAPSSATDISKVSKNSNQSQSHQLLQREVFLCEGKIVFPKKSTTVFVGKIPETLDAQGVDGLLNCCGRVKSWKRASHFETEKPKHFGFVEYFDALSCIKAVRVLNALQVDKSQLMAKGNQATIKYMEEFMKYFRTEAEASYDDKYECTGLRKEIAEFLEKRESKDAADAFFQTLGGAGGAAISTGEDSSPGRQHDAGAGKKGKASSSASKPSGADERRLRRSDQQLYERSLKQFEIDEERRRNSKRRSLEREESYARERLALIEREEERAEERGQEASHGDGASKIFRQHLKGMLNSGGGSTLADSEDHHSNSRRGGSSSSQNRKEAKERRLKRKREIEEDGLDRQLEEREKEEEAQRQISVTVKSVSKVRKNISSVFGADEESGEQPKGLDIMAQIPVEKEAVFAYPIDWKLFPLVSSSVEKWVLQKTVELLGEEEHSLKEFVMKKLSKDTVSAEGLVKQLEPILEEESSVFVHKLFRLIIYSILKL